MAESTQAALYSTLTARTGVKIGFSRDSASWTTEQGAKIVDILDGGIRQVHFPPVLPGESEPHRFSFLTPTTTLVIWPSYTALSTRLVNTATINNAVTNNTGSTFYPSMVGRSITIGATTYTVASYVSATEIRLTSDPGNQSAQQWSMSGGDYRLSDDFGAIIGDTVNFAANTGYLSLPVVAEAIIRQDRAIDNEAEAIPIRVAVTPVAPFDATLGQRFDLLVYPLPNGVYTMNFRYHVLPNKLTSDQRVYGGTPYADLYIQSCLAEAEHYMDDTRGVEYQRFMERLQAAVGFDRRMQSPFIGPMLGRETDFASPRGVDWSSRTFTYNGAEIP